MSIKDSWLAASLSLLSPPPPLFLLFCFILKGGKKTKLFCPLLSRKAPFFLPLAALHLLSSKNSFSFATSTAEAHFVFHLSLMHNAGREGEKDEVQVHEIQPRLWKGPIVFEGEAIFFIKAATHLN